MARRGCYFTSWTSELGPDAFVSDHLKLDRSDVTGHLSDARSAVHGFQTKLGTLAERSRIHVGEHGALNLAAAAAMAAGAEIAHDEIDMPLLVIDGA